MPQSDAHIVPLEAFPALAAQPRKSNPRRAQPMEFSVGSRVLTP